MTILFHSPLKSAKAFGVDLQAGPSNLIPCIDSVIQDQSGRPFTQ